jgi:hypothetical protein
MDVTDTRSFSFAQEARYNTSTAFVRVSLGGGEMSRHEVAAGGGERKGGLWPTRRRRRQGGARTAANGSELGAVFQAYGRCQSRLVMAMTSCRTKATLRFLRPSQTATPCDAASSAARNVSPRPILSTSSLKYGSASTSPADGRSATLVNIQKVASMSARLYPPTSIASASSLRVSSPAVATIDECPIAANVSARIHAASAMQPTPHTSAAAAPALPSRTSGGR